MAADFKPTLDGYKDLKPFVFWAQTTLPTVFDDSLSYYEVLTKLTKMVNVLLENTDTAEHNIEALATVFTQLQDYVNHYFDSLDVSAEVDKKLDEMVADGTLNEIILPIVQHYTEEIIDDVVHEQLSAVVSEQIGPEVANQIDAAIAPQITPKVNSYLAANLPQMVADEVPLAVGEQIDPAVATLLPSVVDEQLPNAVSTEMATALPPVVQSQLPGVVATQIPGAVSSQMPAVLAPIATQQINTLVPNWLATHIHNPSSPPLDDTLGLKNCAAESWYVGRRFFDLQGSPATMEEDKKVVYQTGEVVEAEHWLTFTATVSDKFPCSVGYPHFDLEQDPVVDWTYAYYNANGDYIANSGNTWQGFINWSVVTEPVPDGAATIKFSIQSDAADFVSGDLAVLVFGNGAQIIDAINAIDISIALDDTLTQPDKAADAKAAGDRISALEAADTKTEDFVEYLQDSVMDGCIPYGLHGAIKNAGFTVSADGNTLTLNGHSSATSSQWGTKILISDHLQSWNAYDDPAAAQVNTIPTVNGRVYRLTLNVISGTIDPATGSGGMRLYVKGTTDIFRTIRYGTNTGSITFVGDGQPVRIVLVMQRLIDVTDLKLNIVLKDITDTQNNNLLDSTFADKTISIVGPFTTNMIWTETENGMSKEESIYSYSAGDAIPVTPGDHLYIRIFGGNSTNQNPVTFARNDYTKVTTYEGTRNAWNNFDLYVPEEAAFLLLNTTSMANTRKVEVLKVVGLREKTSFEGCKLSLLGDSLSAIAAYCTHYYYPSEDSDVYSGEQMWWKIVCEQTGMTPLVVGAWSGSCVMPGLRESSITPASDPARCEALNDGTTNPDVILLAVGANDYSYMSDASQFGTWDGKTALGSAADLSDYDTSTFKTAYATMIARIQKAYPNAYLIAITPWYLQRYTTNTGANYLNAIGKDISDYSDAVRDVCRIMHVPCIDGTNIGFNRYNYYPTYSEDSATKATHPTAAGQAQIAKAIIGQLKTLHRLGS